MNLLEEKSLADADVQEDPVAYYRALRQEPLHWDPRLGVYICSTYALMREILRDPDTFSSVDSQSVEGMRPPPAEALAIRRQLLPPVNTLVTNDPPGHTRIRRMVDEPFRPRAIETLRAGIREIVNETLDGFIGRGQADVVAEFAIPIPIKVIADMLGIPRQMAPDIKAWSDASVDPLGMMVSDARLIECARIIKSFQDYIVAELEERRARPRDDLLTRLVQARDEDGAGFSMAEMLSLTQQFLVAGNETTTNAIAAGVQLLIDNPEQYAELERRPDRLLTFANEILRLESPAAGLFRVVRRDTTLAGVTLPAGSRIMLRFAAANRDPGKYANADALDVHRSNAGTHVGFGAGIHHCIGANLAREELVQTFDILLARVKNLAYRPGANDFRHHPSMILRGLKRLEVTFQAR
jgi:cytochrome P450